MRFTLKDLVKRALADIEVEERGEWFKKWPGQVILAVD